MIAFLYVIIIGSMSNDNFRYGFPTMEACQKSLATLKQDNRGGSTVITFCANESNHRHYNATWWEDPTKSSK